MVISIPLAADSFQNGQMIRSDHFNGGRRLQRRLPWGKFLLTLRQGGDVLLPLLLEFGFFYVKIKC